ncbi:MAG TPA: helix-turn-helix transcriptional regulator [Herpetosiphonaceae bacterium]|nr:helix-turn-helix transcriptional regulator [Herpetosiphonaceae bacterium]
MITNRTQEIAREHGVNSPRELAQRLGVAQNTAYNLWRGNTERIDLPILQKICREFGVTPGDVLKYEPENTTGNYAPGLALAW